MVLRNAFADLVAASKPFRREFNDATFAEWDVVTGSGMSVAATASNLVITTGTTINAETTVTSKAMFEVPMRASFGLMISQKIANQEFYVELIACNDTTGVVDETIVAAWRVAGNDSLTSGVARYDVQNGGAARLQSGNTATLGTQLAMNLWEITIENDEVWFSQRTADGVGARTASFVRNTVSPNPLRKYKVRYRVRNGSVAPASSTTFTSSSVTVIDYTDQKVEVTGGTGDLSTAQAVPAYISGSVSLSTTSVLSASATTTGTTAAKVNSAATTNATLPKNTAGRFYGYHLSNTSAAWRYVKLLNSSATPVPGTSVPTLVIPIGPGQTVAVALPVPITFGSGFGYWITAGSADLDNTAVAAGDVVGHLLFI